MYRHNSGESGRKRERRDAIRRPSWQTFRDDAPKSVLGDASERRWESITCNSPHVVEDAGPRALVGACAHFTLREYVVDGLLLETASVLLHDRVYMLPGAQAIPTMLICSCYSGLVPRLD